MAKYYADCEFESHTGKLLSLGMVTLAKDNESRNKALYLVDKVNVNNVTDPWVKEHVVPYMFESVYDMLPGINWEAYISYTSDINPNVRKQDMFDSLEAFLKGDEDITIVVDWPEDVKYISDLMLTGPGTMIDIPSFKFEVLRVDAFPNSIPGCIQHNALCDAYALMALCISLDRLKVKEPVPYKLSTLMVALLKHTKQLEYDSSIDALTELLKPIYHEEMTFTDVITILCKVYSELISEPRFEHHNKCDRHIIEHIVKAPVDWHMGMRLGKLKPLTMESELKVIEFYQPIISTMLSAFRLSRVDWCSDQLK
jgi:hypothetical protein